MFKILKKTILAALVIAGFSSVASITANQALAGTDLDINCSAIGTCAISPANTPLFQEADWLPGSSTTQYFRMSNSSSQDGFSSIEVINYRDEVNDLGEVVQVEIREGSPTGNVVYGGVTLHQFRDDGYFTFDESLSGQVTEYYVTLTMPTYAGNKYQAAGVLFDLNFGLELEAIPPDSGGGDGSGDSGSTSPAEPYVCTAETPTSAPSLSVSNPTANTVNLSWDSVSPVTHYALIFTRDSDGEQYGSTNIGNVTSYTVTNLSGGESYTFEIFGVNDCAPGPRSNLASTGTITGAVLAPDVRPLGGDGAVLGVDDDLEDEENESEGEILGEIDENKGEVLGVESCAQWKFYIPWILLVLQAIIILLVDYKFRDSKGFNKHILALVTTAISIIIFYLLRSCNCYVDGSFLAWLCKWYWIVAAVISILLQIFNYAFIENIEEESEVKETKKQL